MHYQPKISLESGEITGVEALIRWMHPDRGLVPPSQFVPIAEECGLILPIGQWVLLEACRQARAWRDLGLRAVPVAVNVSAVEFLAKDFLSGVRAALIATGVEPRNLELELTESVLIIDAESTIDTLHALKAIGVQLAVDDFGTGYSSFSYLRRFPLDALKIDRSFVRDITVDPNDATKNLDDAPENNAPPVASGAFTFKEWIPGETLTALDFPDANRAIQAIREKIAKDPGRAGKIV